MKTPRLISESGHLPLSARWDIVLLPALFVFNCFTFSAWLELAQVATKPWLLLVWAYGLAMLLPLVWRDRAPWTVFSTQCVLTAAAWPIMPHFTPAVGIVVAAYAVSAHCGRSASWLAMLASLIPTGLAASVAFRSYADPRDQLASFTGNLVFFVLMTFAAWCVGRMTQANQRRVQRLEREQQSAREAVFAERRRIARELHDIVSHAVAVIVLQSAGAARVADTHLAQVKQSLAHIETTGKQAIAELQRMLGVLDAGEPTSYLAGSSELGPQRGLADLPALLNSLRTTGMPVTLDIEGASCELEPSVDLAAYRIIQEGLTNALKHAGHDADPRLRLTWQDHRLIIQIDNAVRPSGAPRQWGLSGGRGLVGLRERAHAVGGRLHAGPQHDGGYRLIATLPLPEQPQLATLAMAGAGDNRRMVSP